MVGGVCRLAKRARNPDSVGEANGDAVAQRKASIEAFLEFRRITGLRPVSGLPIRSELANPFYQTSAVKLLIFLDPR